MKISNTVKTYLTQEQLDKVDVSVLEQYEVVTLDKPTKRNEVCYVQSTFADSEEDAQVEVEEAFDKLSTDEQRDHGVRNFYIRHFQDTQRNVLRSDLGLIAPTAGKRAVADKILALLGDSHSVADIATMSSEELLEAIRNATK